VEMGGNDDDGEEDAGGDEVMRMARAVRVMPAMRMIVMPKSK
jgi:hypothetical protein